MRAGIGDNSYSFGQALDQQRETSWLPRDETVRFLYANIHIGDWVTATLGMTPEVEGAYFRFIIRLYQRGRAFPDDDRLLCAAMGMTIRVWRRLKKVLVETGKILCKGGCLTNSRFEKERVKRAEMLRKQAQAARKRHAKEPSLPKVCAKFAESLPEVSPKVSPNNAKKTNKINDPKVTNHVPPESRILNPESSNKKILTHPESDSSAARESAGVGEISGINGATSLIVERLAGWINPLMPDKRTARGWLESSVSIYGATVVRDSFAELEAKALQGDIIARPIPLLTKICQRRANERPVSSVDWRDEERERQRELKIILAEYAQKEAANG